jgi:hypothetical protein
MTRSKFLYGFFGALLGFLFASTLALHEGWAHLEHFRKKRQSENRQATNSAFLFSTLALVPILLFIGFLGSPFISGYAAHRCRKDESLQPLIDTLTEPYLSYPGDSKIWTNLKTGMLLGYSTILVLTTFTLINLVTQNAFGMLGTAGGALLNTFGISQHSLLSAFLGTLGLTYLGGVVGGTLAAGSTYVGQQYFGWDAEDLANDRFRYELMESPTASPPELPNDITLTLEPTHQNRSENNPNQFPHLPPIFSHHWIKKQSKPMDLMQNDDSDEEDVIVFEKPQSPLLKG